MSDLPTARREATEKAYSVLRVYVSTLGQSLDPWEELSETQQDWLYVFAQDLLKTGNLTETRRNYHKVVGGVLLAYGELPMEYRLRDDIFFAALKGYLLAKGFPIPA